MDCKKDVKTTHGKREREGRGASPCTQICRSPKGDKKPPSSVLADSQHFARVCSRGRTVRRSFVRGLSYYDVGTEGEGGGAKNLPILRTISILRSVDLSIKGCVKSRAFLLRSRACFPSPSAHARVNALFYPQIPSAQYILRTKRGEVVKNHILLWTLYMEAP